jgi:2'-phosphotransferase
MAPRGGQSDRNKRDPLPRNVQISKKLSWLLRHGAEGEKLPLGPGGFANLADVLNNRKIRGLQASFDEVREVVEENEKQRFTMVPASSAPEGAADTAADGQIAEGSNGAAKSKQNEIASTDPKDWKIRANQGHSLKIEEDGLLEPITLTDADIPETAVHGTTHAAWPRILASGGLKPMGRNHVHFASGLPAGFKSLNSTSGEDASSVEAPVISGMRSTSTILVFLDLKKALEAGLKFWRSDNGVVLSEGNEDGVVLVEYFKRVEDRTGEGVLLDEGKVVKEAPAHWAKSGFGGGGRGRGRGRGRG